MDRNSPGERVTEPFRFRLQINSVQALRRVLSPEVWGNEEIMDREDHAIPISLSLLDINNSNALQTSQRSSEMKTPIDSLTKNHINFVQNTLNHRENDSELFI